MSSFQDTVKFNWVAGSKLIVRRGMTGATGNIYCGLHEFYDMGFLLHFLNEDDTFVDIGANVGSYTVLASSVCHADVIAVEPDPETMKSLRANVACNGSGNRVEFVEAALGAINGAAHFTIGQDTVNHIAHDEGVPTREVAMCRLDDVVARRSVHLLKMDVEGYEAEVLAGARQVLEQPSLIAVISESSSADVQDQLDGHGFRRYAYEPFTRQLTPWSDNAESQQNALFIRDVETARRRVANAPRREIAGVAF